MNDPRITCDVCPRSCRLKEGERGYCGVRERQGDSTTSIAYGLLSAIALDPIEKKPLADFRPGSQILSIGSVGCNMACPFCQNYSIAKMDPQDMKNLRSYTLEEILAMAERTKAQGNIGVAFTYNEPLVNIEFVMDLARFIRDSGMETVMVTNGQVTKKYLDKLLPLISAWNIDLKAYSEEAYRRLGGDFKTTLQTIKEANKHAHVEVTTLVVPGLSDDLESFAKQIDFLASLDPQPILHLSRYFPRYRYEEPATLRETLEKMKQVAEEKLKRVHLGNV